MNLTLALIFPGSTLERTPSFEFLAMWSEVI